MFCAQRTITPDDVSSELLPRGWNNQEKTALRYSRDNNLYIMHGTYNEGSAFFNLLVSPAQQPESTTLKLICVFLIESR